MTALQDEVVDGGCVHDWLPLLNEKSSAEFADAEMALVVTWGSPSSSAPILQR
jgi:hypothetical protein